MNDIYLFVSRRQEEVPVGRYYENWAELPDHLPISLAVLRVQARVELLSVTLGLAGLTATISIFINTPAGMVSSFSQGKLITAICGVALIALAIRLYHLRASFSRSKYEAGNWYLEFKVALRSRNKRRACRSAQALLEAKDIYSPLTSLSNVIRMRAHAALALYGPNSERAEHALHAIGRTQQNWHPRCAFFRIASAETLRLLSKEQEAVQVIESNPTAFRNTRRGLIEHINCLVSTGQLDAALKVCEILSKGGTGELTTSRFSLERFAGRAREAARAGKAIEQPSSLYFERSTYHC